MAQFNPDVPQSQAPSYLGLSKPIDPPQPDRTSSTIISGLANVFDSTIKTADLAVKTNIDNIAATAVDQERDAFTASLQDPSVVAASRSAGGSAMNILPESAAGDVPGSVEGGISGVQALAAANAAGKISPTYYYGRLNSLLKNLRSEYPGYRDYIDQKVSQLVGTNPANAYVASLIRDLNVKAAAAGTGDYTKQMVQFAITHQDDMPDGSRWAQAVAQDPSKIPAYQEARNKWMAPKVEADRLKAEQDAAMNTGKYDSSMATRNANAYLPTLISSRINSMTNAAGINMSTQDIMNIVEQARLGKIDMDGEQWQQLGQMVSAFRERTAREARAEATRQGWIEKMGSQAWNENLNAALNPYDQLARAITEKDIPLALSQLESIKAVQASSTYNLLRDKNSSIYKTLTMANAAKTMGGDAVSQFIIAKGFNSGLDKELTEFYKNQAYSAVTQPDMTKGHTYSLAEAFNAARAANVKDPHFYKNITDVNDIISDPKAGDVAKANVAYASYGPGNSKFISMFPDSARDPNNPNRLVPGKVEAFQQMTMPDKTAEIWRLAGGNPNSPIWTQYKNWAQESWGMQIFNTQIKDLNKLQQDPRILLSWNPETHNYKVLVTGKRVPSFLQQGSNASNEIPESYVRQVQDKINYLNSGLSNLANIAKQEGSDVDAYLLSRFKDAGVVFQPGGMSLPDQLYNTLVHSRNASQSPAGARTGDKNGSPRGGALPFAEETNRGRSMQQFLQNPTGIAQPAPARVDPLAINGDILSMQVDQIPEGMDARTFIQQLQQQQKRR